mgnify:CR=1 FL=1
MEAEVWEKEFAEVRENDLTDNFIRKFLLTINMLQEEFRTVMTLVAR